MISGDYLIVVEGEMTKDLHTAFAEFEVSASGGTTTIHAPGCDQAALHGLLARAHDLGLTVLALRLESDPAETTPEG